MLRSWLLWYQMLLIKYYNNIQDFQACFQVHSWTKVEKIALYRVWRDDIYTRFFMNFAKYFLIPESVEVEVHTVPHFKAPINAKVEP